MLETWLETCKIIEGKSIVDDRGVVSFVNDFDFKDVKRFYTVTNHKIGFIRAWHGHKKESKYVYCVKGSALIGTLPIFNWEDDGSSEELMTFSEMRCRTQSKESVQKFVLSANTPSVLFIPAGYANGFMSLTDDCILTFFSTATLEESKGDDYRFPARLWDIWHIEER